METSSELVSWRDTASVHSRSEDTEVGSAFPRSCSASTVGLSHCTHQIEENQCRLNNKIK